MRISLGWDSLGRISLAWIVPVLVAACGRFPEGRQVTSGAIRCPPNQVVITNFSERFTGEKSWKATCGGKAFYCSMSSSPSNQTTCTPAQPAVIAPAPAPAPAPVTPVRYTTPPKGVAGFEFGQTQEVVTEKCGAAGGGFALSGKGGTCNVTPVPVGFEAETRMDFCGTGLCAIQALHHFAAADEQAASAAYTKVAQSLRVKYGKPLFQAAASLPCQQQLYQCLSSKTASMASQWKWPTGESIRLVLSAEGPDLVLSLVYRTANTADVQGL